MGAGQCGMTALYAAAVDERLSSATVVDYFQQREGCWKEPVDRMLYGQLNEFGDAEVAALIAPRPLTIVHTPAGPTPAPSVKAEVERAHRFYRGLGQSEELAAREEREENALEAGALRTVEKLGANQIRNQPNITLRISDQSIEESRNDRFEALHRYLRRLGNESDQLRNGRWKLISTPAEDRAHRVAELRLALQCMMGVIPTLVSEHGKNMTWRKIGLCLTSIGETTDILGDEGKPEIIWSGPSTEIIPVRRIDQVLYDLIQ
jgi:hypothetical protein